MAVNLVFSITHESSSLVLNNFPKLKSIVVFGREKLNSIPSYATNLKNDAQFLSLTKIHRQVAEWQAITAGDKR